MEFAIIQEGGEVLTREAEEFLLRAHFLGLSSEMRGKPFLYHGTVMKVVGLRVKNRSYPVLVEDEKGKRFKFRAEDVKAFLTK